MGFAGVERTGGLESFLLIRYRMPMHAGPRLRQPFEAKLQELHLGVSLEGLSIAPFGLEVFPAHRSLHCLRQGMPAAGRYGRSILYLEPI